MSTTDGRLPENRADAVGDAIYALSGDSPGGDTSVGDDWDAVGSWEVAISRPTSWVDKKAG